MALSRTHTSAKAADPAKLLLLNNRPVNTPNIAGMTRPSPRIPVAESRTLLPSPDRNRIILTLIRDPDYHHNPVVSYLARALPFHEILWKSLE